MPRFRSVLSSLTRRFLSGYVTYRARVWLLRRVSAALVLAASLHSLLLPLGVALLFGNRKNGILSSFNNLLIEVFGTFRSCIGKSQHCATSLQLRPVTSVQGDISGDLFPQPQVLGAE